MLRDRSPGSIGPHPNLHKVVSRVFIRKGKRSWRYASIRLSFSSASPAQVPLELISVTHARCNGEHRETLVLIMGTQVFWSEIVDTNLRVWLIDIFLHVKILLGTHYAFYGVTFWQNWGPMQKIQVFFAFILISVPDVHAENFVIHRSYQTSPLATHWA